MPSESGNHKAANAARTAANTFGNGRYKGIFDSIDENSIENSLSLADSIIKKNKSSGAYSALDPERLPNLRGGLATFYAASESGNHKAADIARKIAYTETSEKSNTLTVGSETKRVNAENKKVQSGERSSPSEERQGEIKKTPSDEQEKVEQNSFKTDPDQLYSYPSVDFPTLFNNIFPTVDAKIDFYKSIFKATTGSKEERGHHITTAVFDFVRSIPLFGFWPRTLKQLGKPVWKIGADLFLRKYKGYDFSADLLEHSLQEKPNDVVFYDDSYVADIIKKDNDFLNKVDSLVHKAETNTPFNSYDNDLEFVADDMYYSLHNCTIELINIKNNKDGTKSISVHISDEYDYTKIWTMMGEKGVSLGTLANDGGVVSTWLDAINPYHVDIYLTIRR